MRSGSFKAVKHLSNIYKFFVARRLKWKDFVFPSTLQLASSIEKLLEPIKSPEIYERIHLGLHEALVNAVIHGNSSNPDKKLRVRRILTPNWIIWQIQDQGDGISLNDRRFDLPSRNDVSHGRGLFLIHHCFEDVRWSRRGNRLQLAARRQILINAEDSSEP